MPEVPCDTCGRPSVGGVRRYTDPQGRARVGCADDNACRDAFLQMSPAQRKAVEQLADEGYYLRLADAAAPAPEQPAERQPAPVAHVITVEQEARPGGLTVYRAVCSCGRYISTRQGSERNALRAGQDHVDAMEARHG